MALPAAERQILAALAVVGQASLSESELAELVEIDGVGSVIDDLERRGLIKRDERERYSILGRVGEEIRKTDDALATGDQLMQYMKTLAHGGALTPERLAEDAQAILGLSEWAAENRQWTSLLELVKTLQACFGIAQRVPQWLVLLDQGRRAARALGDTRSEIWVLQQMATAAESAGDTTAARRYLREADELQRGRVASGSGADGAETAVRVAGAGEGSGRTLAWWILGLVVTAGAGFGVGYGVGSHGGGAGATTAQVSITATVQGHTVTTPSTVTLPATTVVSVSTQVTTATVTTVTTVTTTPPLK